MPVSDEHAMRTAVAAIIAAVSAVIAAAKAEVYADTSIGVGGADGGCACSDGERGSGSQKDFL